MNKDIKRGFWKSVFTDDEWDGEFSKVFGCVIIIVGLVGYLNGKDPTAVLAFGSGLAGLDKIFRKK